METLEGKVKSIHSFASKTVALGLVATLVALNLAGCKPGAPSSSFVASSSGSQASYSGSSTVVASAKRHSATLKLPDDSIYGQFEGRAAKVVGGYGTKFALRGNGSEMKPRNRPHPGIDVFVPWGSKITSGVSGVASVKKNEYCGGWDVRVSQTKLGGSLSIEYAHLRKTYVSTGDQVLDNRTVLGESGGCPGEYGHVHFAVLSGGLPRDPMPFLRGKPHDGQPGTVYCAEQGKPYESTVSNDKIVELASSGEAGQKKLADMLAEMSKLPAVSWVYCTPGQQGALPTPGQSLAASDSGITAMMGASYVNADGKYHKPKLVAAK